MLKTTSGGRGPSHCCCPSGSAAAEDSHHDLNDMGCDHLVESNICTLKANTSGDWDCMFYFSKYIILHKSICKQNPKYPKSGNFQTMLFNEGG